MDWNEVPRRLPAGVTGRVTCTAVPVQVEGEVDGQPFYFRGRHGEVTLGIGGEPVLDPEWQGDVDLDEAGWLSPEETVAVFSDLHSRWKTQVR